jgi:hypothetical protein
MGLGRRNQTVGWADDRSPTNSLDSRNGGTRPSAHPTLWLKSGIYSEHVPNERAQEISELVSPRLTLSRVVNSGRERRLLPLAVDAEL